MCYLPSLYQLVPGFRNSAWVALVPGFCIHVGVNCPSLVLLVHDMFRLLAHSRAAKGRILSIEICTILVVHSAMVAVYWVQRLDAHAVVVWSSHLRGWLCQTSVIVH